MGDAAAPATGEPHEELLYQEVGRVVGIFWEWRHKVLLLCATSVSFALAAAAWSYRYKLGGVVIGAPLGFAAVVVLACRAFDRRNSEIIDACLGAGRELESGLTARADLRIYTRILETRHAGGSRARPLTYGQMLSRGYLALAGLLLVLTFAAWVIAGIHPEMLIPNT